MASITLTRGNTLPDSSAKSDFHNLVDQASAAITNIVNADVSNSAAIGASKVDLSTIAQNIAMSGKVINYAKGSDIASATTTDIWASTGNFIDVTGTTTITGLGTVQAGAIRFVRFTGILTLTHNATSLILPTTANITTAANDRAIFASLGSGNGICLAYQRADGTPLVATLDFASQSEVEAASSTTKAVTPGRTQYHPGVAKGWCTLDGTGTVSILASHNVSGIVDDGTGLYTVTWATDFSSANYAIIATALHVTKALMCTVVSQTAGACQIRVIENAAGDTDVDMLHVVAFGDQA